MLATVISSTEVSWRWRVINFGVNMLNARIVPPSLLRSKPFLLQFLYDLIRRCVQQCEMLRHHCPHVRDYQAMKYDFWKRFPRNDCAIDIRRHRNWVASYQWRIAHTAHWPRIMLAICDTRQGGWDHVAQDRAWLFPGHMLPQFVVY